MLSVNLPKKLEALLSELALKTKKTESYYVCKALENFFDNQGDYLLALADWEEFEKRGEKAIPFEDISK